MVAVIPFSGTDLQRSAELPAWPSVNAKHAPSQCLPTLPLPVVPPCFSSGHPAQPVDTLLTCDLPCSCSLSPTSPMFLPPFRSHCLFLPSLLLPPFSSSSGALTLSVSLCFLSAPSTPQQAQATCSFLGRDALRGLTLRRKHTDILAIPHSG